MSPKSSVHGPPDHFLTTVCGDETSKTLPLLAPAAIVVETGGPLGHVAAQALNEAHRIPRAEAGRLAVGAAEWNERVVGERGAIGLVDVGGAEECIEQTAHRALLEVASRCAPEATAKLAESLVPEEQPATWAVAVMELGALVCTAANPSCPSCPVEDLCAWNQTGRPAYDGPPRRGQAWAGTDRMVRGRLMAVLREAQGSVDRPRMETAWSEPVQRDRALQSLIADGLVVESDDRYALPC